MALSIDIAANTRQAQAQVKDLGRSLGDVADSLDDLARGAQAGDKIERALDGAGDAGAELGRDLDRAGEKVERTFEEMVRDVKKADDAIDNVGRTGKKSADDVRDSFRRAEGGVEEFGDEAKSTARESAASFDGSAESIADAFQEVAANAFGGFGPAGMVAGLAAAAGIGMAVKGFEDIGVAQEASEEAAADWANSYVEAGGRVLSSAITTARALTIITDTEGKFKEAEANAKNWGVSIETAVAAMSGETWALSAAQEALAERSRAAQEALAEQEAQVNSSAGSAYDLADSVDAGEASLSKLTGEMEAGANRADVYSRYLATMAQNTAGATSKVDEFGDSVYSLPDGTKVYVDAETGQATQDVDAIERRIYGIPDGEAKIKVNDSEVRNYRPPTLYLPARVQIDGRRPVIL